jgi:rhomboid-like protein
MAKGQSNLTEPPKMKMWQRLLPSTTLVLALIGLCVAYAEFYQPAKRADRWFPDIPPAAVTVGTLIALNLAGWVLWKLPPIWGLLNQYFIVVVATPRAATMVSAMFSHQSLGHLLQNMVILWFLGVRFHDEVGRGTFLATYFASGALGAFGTLSWAVLTNRLTITSLGASGAIYGVGAAYLWLHRFDAFRIFGLPPPPRDGVEGLTLLAFAAALNIGAAFTAKRFTIDITGHLVGMIAGILGGHLIERKRAAKKGIAVATRIPVATK